MAEKEIDLRRLVIKAFHMTDVEWGEHNNITTDGHMTVSKEMIDQLVAQDDCIEKIDIQIIKPGDHDRWTNTIMDIIPISTKVPSSIILVTVLLYISSLYPKEYINFLISSL